MWNVHIYVSIVEADDRVIVYVFCSCGAKKVVVKLLFNVNKSSRVAYYFLLRTTYTTLLLIVEGQDQVVVMGSRRPLTRIQQFSQWLPILEKLSTGCMKTCKELKEDSAFVETSRKEQSVARHTSSLLTITSSQY